MWGEWRNKLGQLEDRLVHRIGVLEKAKMKSELIPHGEDWECERCGSSDYTTKTNVAFFGKVLNGPQLVYLSLTCECGFHGQMAAKDAQEG